ncbi:MAG: dipeptidyl aminopeptidase [Halobacteriovoraceae bacterium]|nr:dipeptidyl aminopeptidase [Halobacteriovoraceae bacterium]|tara:strand:+ start:494 stop:1291 length:798 start_codon:yes stop_codon:yes gene_type:complete
MRLFFFFIFLSHCALASHCNYTNQGQTLKCSHKSLTLDGLYAKREVLFALPESPPPPKGYPVALFFQGSFFPMKFERNKSDPFGGFNEILTIQALLEAGFMVIAPKAGANLFWQSNLIGIIYDLSSDKYLINKILTEIKAQTFGHADTENIFALGISSGGYMTDRMAHSHKHQRFNALAIASASYAKCGGPYCPLPDEIDPNHPPTLFMHGRIDPVVPIITMRLYDKKLRENGVKTKKIVQNTATHQWLKKAPKAVVSWFKAHLR